MSISDVTVNEGNSGSSNATFTVSLSGTSSQTVTVDYASVAGTATSPADYGAVSGGLTFVPGDTSETITVPVAGDLLDEDDENYTIALSSPVNATLGDNLGLGTITDDDAEPTISVGDVSVTEGNSGTVDATFNVTLSAPSGRAASVVYETGEDTASGTLDFVTQAFFLDFAAGETSKTVTVQVIGDVLDEANETFFLRLLDPTNATLGDAEGVGTIDDDDAEPTLSVGDVTVFEGNAGTTAATFTVGLSTVSGRDVSVAYATANDSAVAPADYAAASGTLDFPAGDTSKTVTVNVNGDVLDEANEGFLLNLTSPTNATLADDQAVGTITDDDPAPALSIDDVTQLESAPNATFTVSLSAASGQAVTVDYATVDGSAIAPGDYTATSGLLSFAPGEISKTVDVALIGDARDEIDESFTVGLSGASNATIADDLGFGTITDDDPEPSLSVDDVTVTEGNSGTVSATFTATLSAVSGRAVAVNFATANDSAVAPGDFAAAAGTLNFAAGVTTQTVTVNVNGDLLDEPTESFFVNLSLPSNATLGDGQGVGTITDDDTEPTVSVGDAMVTEGDAGTTNAVFTVSLSSQSGLPVTVDYSSTPGTATSPADFAAVSGGLSFAAGETTQTITVAVAGDLLDEDVENYTIGLSNPSNAALGDDLGLGTINDNDPLPALSVSDVTVTEGNAGTVNAVFTVTLSPLSGRAASVNYATANDSAVAGSDYTAAAATLNFAAGVTTQTVTVAVNADLLDEANETFFLDLSGATNATISDSRGVGTITDDDPQPSLSLSDVTVNEHEDATFTVTLSTASGRDVTVDYATANGTATSNPPSGEEQDFEAASGSLTFLAGQTSKTVTVTVSEGDHDELDETFFLNLTNPGGATVSDAQGMATIVDNDPPPNLEIDDWSVDEAGNELVFTLSKDRQSGRPERWTTRPSRAPPPRRPTSRRSAGRSRSPGSTEPATSLCRSPSTPSMRPTRRSRSSSPTRTASTSSTESASARSPTTTRRRRSRSTTSQSPRATPARSARPSRPRSPRPAARRCRSTTRPPATRRWPRATSPRRPARSTSPRESRRRPSPST